jgi:energy-coupling factor transporter ATP-binding protein EcfA2
MLLTVKGLRGADHAEIEIERGKITLLGGANGAGKTSILYGAQAVLGAQAVPRKTKNAKDYGKQIVNNTQKEGSATFKSNLGTRIVSYPSCEIRTMEGTAPLCNDWALGVIRLSELSPEERAKQLIEITGTKITRERLEKELKPLNIDEKTIDNLIVTALTTSFETASKRASAHGQELKGEFKASTGIQWGSVQGQTFLPEGWVPELASKTVDELKLNVKEAKAALESSLAQQAIFDHQAKFAGKSTEYGKEVQEWTATIAELEPEIKDWKEKVEISNARIGLVTCSACGFSGHVQDATLVAAGTVTTAFALPHDDMVRKLRDLEERHRNAIYALSLAKGNFDRAVQAQEENDVAPPTDIDGARVTLATAEARLKAKIAKDTGMHLHFRIVDMVKAAEILAPDGLPRTALFEALEYLNRGLAKLCEIAGWKRVQITPDLGLTYNDTPYWLISKSEKFRTDVTLQLTIARLTEQPIVVIDEADILDGPGRGQLVEALAASGLTSIVGMTSSIKKDGSRDIPNLKEHGLGATYWIEKGRAVPL